MGYYDQDFLNYYYYMASQFAVSDRWFSPVSSKSIPNRIATFTGGTTQGLVFDPGGDDHLPSAQHSQHLPGTRQGQGVVEDLLHRHRWTDAWTTMTAASGIRNANYPATTFSYLTYSYQYLYENPTRRRLHRVHHSLRVWWAIRRTPSASIPITSRRCLAVSYTDLEQWHASQLRLHRSRLRRQRRASWVRPIDPGRSGAGGEHRQCADDEPLVEGFVFFLGYDEGGGPYDHVPPVPGHSNDNTDASLGRDSRISHSIAVNPDSLQALRARRRHGRHCTATWPDQ